VSRSGRAVRKGASSGGASAGSGRSSRAAAIAPAGSRGWGAEAATLLAAERWALPGPPGEGPLRVLLAYPSSYPVAAASLGFQTVYRLLHDLPEVEVDRAWLPSAVLHPGSGGGGPAEECGGRRGGSAARLLPGGLRGVRTGRPAEEFHLIGISLAYELELAGLVQLLELAGLAPLAEQRGPGDPVVLLGGPICWACAELAHPFVDVVLPGEAELALPRLIALLAATRGDKPALLEALSAADEPVVLPASAAAAAAGTPPPLCRCPDELLPAFSAWVTPHSSFGEMFLVEVGRGCNRACAYCVMRRPSAGGLRTVPAGRVLATLPPWVGKVGLVGAAATDHPELPAILQACLEVGRQVGISSLRADRLDETLVDLLSRTGLKTLTTALDGLSERLRRQLQRGTGAGEVLAAARLARQHRLPRFKLYLMIGVPGEEDEDLREGLELCREISAILPLTLTVSPFVPKPRTPLAAAPFAGTRVIDSRLAALRRGLQGRVKIQSVSSRWAWVEHRLAQGGAAAGRAAPQAVGQGGSLAAWERALGR